MDTPESPHPQPPSFEMRIEDDTFVASAGQTLLQAALEAGRELPNSCRNGTCRTCICKLESGDVMYRIEWPGLSREEKASGFILPCVAYPLSDLVLRLGP